MIRVGVVAVQGAASEHMEALFAAAHAAGFKVEVVAVRTPAQLDAVDGIVLPGGESTTISRLLRSSGLHEPIKARGRSGELAILGTCAGLILLASEATRDVANKDIDLLRLLDVEVDRNAFGGQKESFQAMVDGEGLAALPVVFIRAPVVTRVWGETQAIITMGKGIVLAQKGAIIGAAFHPELTPDTRVHERFLAAAAKVSLGRRPTAMAAHA